MANFFEKHKDELLAVFDCKKEIADEQDFYFQKAKDNFEEYLTMDIADIDVDTLITATKQKPFSFKEMLGSYEEDLSGLRGKVKISDSLKRQARPKGRLMCAFDEFTQNSPHNQVLKSVLLLLLRHGKVKTENKKSMRKLLLYFSQVEDIIPSEIRWDALKYHRNNASYRMLIEICRFAVEGLLLTEETGRHKLATWIQDEKMHYLYQRFVLAYYKRHHSEYEPSAAHIDWDITAGEKSGYLPRMETDITLQNGDKKVIIDTKYYSKSMAQNQYGNDKYHEYHLYQMYAYVKNSDKNNSGNVAGVLLYAKTDENTTPDEDLFLSGNRISLKTLDLDKEWKEIAAQLDEVCAWLEYDGTK